MGLPAALTAQAHVWTQVLQVVPSSAGFRQRRLPGTARLPQLSVSPSVSVIPPAGTQPFTSRLPQTCRQVRQVLPQSSGSSQTVVPPAITPLQQRSRRTLAKPPSGTHWPVARDVSGTRRRAGVA